MRLGAFGVLLIAAVASAAELAPKPQATPKPTEIRVSVANRSQKALGLRPLPATAGWRLDVTAPADSADIIDLTPGTPARTLTLTVVGRTLRFDALRFAGGHVYRVQLRAAGKPTSALLVYLYPDPTTVPRPRAGTERVRFAPDEKPADDVGLGAVDKGAL